MLLNGFIQQIESIMYTLTVCMPLVCFEKIEINMNLTKTTDTISLCAGTTCGSSLIITFFFCVACSILKYRNSKKAENFMLPYIFLLIQLFDVTYYLYFFKSKKCAGDVGGASAIRSNWVLLCKQRSVIEKQYLGKSF